MKYNIFIIIFLLLIIQLYGRIILNNNNQIQQEEEEKEEFQHHNDLDIEDNILYQKNINNDHRLLQNKISYSPDTAKSHLIHSLPGLNMYELTEELKEIYQGMKQYSGFIQSDPVHNGNFFYWLFKKENSSSNRPLIIWLNGGPGCSSMDGLWIELGPFQISIDRSSNFKYKVKLNPHSWYKEADLLFIDQPVGTGFSFTSNKLGLASNDLLINQQFYHFLTNFFTIYPEYTKSIEGESFTNLLTTKSVFIMGESHAGHYIPSLTEYILKLNQNLIEKNRKGEKLSSNLYINIDGIALGNPWIEPYHQYDPSKFAYGQGIISKQQHLELDKEMTGKCQKNISNSRFNSFSCNNLLDAVVANNKFSVNVFNKNLNREESLKAKILMYDVRKYITYGNVKYDEVKSEDIFENYRLSPIVNEFPPTKNLLEGYLNLREVREAIHATDSPNRFTECADPPYYALSHQDGKGVTNELAYILSNTKAGQTSKVRVLVFAGTFDLICNHIGVEDAISNLPWSHKDTWNSSKKFPWLANGRPSGWIRNYDALSYIAVSNAGHMVPLDVPEVALYMVKEFLEGKLNTIVDDLARRKEIHHLRENNSRGAISLPPTSTLSTPIKSEPSFIEPVQLPSSNSTKNKSFSSFLLILISILILYSLVIYFKRNIGNKR